MSIVYRLILYLFVHYAEQCEKDKARVLVHCMSGKRRSPAIVIAYLMKCKGWRLAQSYQWVKERRPYVDLSQDIYHQLQEYELKIFGSNDSSSHGLPVFSSSIEPSFSFGFPKTTNPVTVSPFEGIGGTTSIFARPTVEEFTFGASRNNSSVDPSSNDIAMDGS